MKAYPVTLSRHVRAVRTVGLEDLTPFGNTTPVTPQ